MASIDTDNDYFRENIIAWSKKNHRPLPWKSEKDPYKIWLSEIILQQTRVEQGLSYYEKFTKNYPTVKDLADASEEAVFKDWEGLGYYSRARNLHATARHIAYNLNGQFPDTYEGLRTLKGVGDYTAAAIGSFAFGLPYAVLDGNVYRVLSRFFGIETPIDSPKAKSEFNRLAQTLLDNAAPGPYNQAIMDFGATHCTPRQPKCTSCPLKTVCVALRLGKVDILPVKSKKIIKKTRFFLYWVLNYEGQTWVRRRAGKDIWQGLYEFPVVELDALPESTETVATQLSTFFGTEFAENCRITALSQPYRQVLTHQVVCGVFCRIECRETPDLAASEGFLATEYAFLKKKFAFPRLIDTYISEKSLTLGFI